MIPYDTMVFYYTLPVAHTYIHSHTSTHIEATVQREQYPLLAYFLQLLQAI